MLLKVESDAINFYTWEPGDQFLGKQKPCEKEVLIGENKFL